MGSIKDMESFTGEHLAENTPAGTLSELARSINHDRTLNDDELFAENPFSSEEVLDALVKAVRDRRAGR